MTRLHMQTAVSMWRWRYIIACLFIERLSGTSWPNLSQVGSLTLSFPFTMTLSRSVSLSICLTPSFTMTLTLSLIGSHLDKFHLFRVGPPSPAVIHFLISSIVYFSLQLKIVSLLFVRPAVHLYYFFFISSLLSCYFLLFIYIFISLRLHSRWLKKNPIFVFHCTSLNPDFTIKKSKISGDN